MPSSLGPRPSCVYVLLNEPPGATCNVLFSAMIEKMPSSSRANHAQHADAAYTAPLLR